MDYAQIAKELSALAIDIASRKHCIGRVKYYDPAPETGLARTPVVPRAIHLALCEHGMGNPLPVILEDEDAELVICDRCKLAVENSEPAW